MAAKDNFKYINKSTRNESDVDIDPSDFLDGEILDLDLFKSKTKNKEDSEEAEDDDKKDSDDSPNQRDKDKELKEMIKDQLSGDTQNVINLNESELDNIIEQLRKRGLSRDKGVELHKIRNIKMNPRTIGH